MSRHINKNQGIKIAISAAEILLYFLPTISYGYSYSTYNEETGESGMEVVHGWVNLFTELWGPTIFCPLMLAGLGIAVVALVLNASNMGSKEIQIPALAKCRMNTRGKLTLAISTIWLIGLFLVVNLFCGSTA